MGHTLRLINENTNNRLVLGAGYLGVNQLEAMVDCHLVQLSPEPVAAIEFVTHRHLPKASRPKRKSGRETHRTRTPCLRASCELYGKGTGEASRRLLAGNSGAKHFPFVSSEFSFLSCGNEDFGLAGEQTWRAITVRRVGYPPLIERTQPQVGASGPSVT